MLKRVVRILSSSGHWFVEGLLRNCRNVGTALVQIWANKGRSILTTLGIIIAVTSIVTVVSFVEGFGNYVTQMMRGYGTQYMVVHPFFPRGRHAHGMGRLKLNMQDVSAVRAECADVSRLSPFIYTHNAEVKFGDEKAEQIPMRGVSEHYQTIRSFFVDAGRFFGPIDVGSAAQVVVLGRSVVKQLQSDEAIVGEHVYIDGLRFKVIGLLEAKGSFMGDDQDETIMVPYTTALKMYPERRDRVSFLAEATSEEKIDAAYAQITRVLRKRHGLQPGQPNDFFISRQDQALGEFEKIKIIASSILGGIVSISLLVGGIGIMNIMLVSVTERTPEIGLRKSVGARRRDIMLQFLTEAVVLCTLGGCVGVALGYGIAHLGSLHPKMVDLEVPLWSVALALVFSAGTGIVFGIIPAFKAAILHPIDALRHE
ncbi:MAG: ABC transporter permease [Planctomycetes bacterium]|nr:ABC transporter permease [Planctomycetota bacterium]